MTVLLSTLKRCSFLSNPRTETSQQLRSLTYPWFSFLIGLKTVIYKHECNRDSICLTSGRWDTKRGQDCLIVEAAIWLFAVIPVFSTSKSHILSYFNKVGGSSCVSRQSNICDRGALSKKIKGNKNRDSHNSIEFKRQHQLRAALISD